jgi:hypothetical protein
MPRSAAKAKTSPLTVPSNMRYADLVRNYQRDAREAQHGLWRPSVVSGVNHQVISLLYPHDNRTPVAIIDQIDRKAMNTVHFDRGHSEPSCLLPIMTSHDPAAGVPSPQHLATVQWQLRHGRCTELGAMANAIGGRRVSSGYRKE